MNFPAGIIQPPFFSAHYPSTWNYAALGSVMGHEVSGRSRGSQALIERETPSKPAQLWFTERLDWVD